MKHFFSALLALTGLAGAAQSPVDVQHYRYEVELSDASDAITGKATITVRFTQPVSQWSLDLYAVEDDKGMQVFAVKDGQASAPFVHRGDKVHITLASPPAAGETRQFEISYMGVPRDGLIISKNRHGDRTFFSDNWPDRAHHWMPCVDQPADKASVEFIVTAPAHYRVVSNGLLQEEKETGKGLRRTHWKEDMPIPTKVMVIGAARFAVARVDSAYHVPVTAWVYPQDSARGVYDYALADDCLRYFEALIGPFPYRKLANVQSTTIFGGMENASAIFYAENSVTGTRSSESLIAHEVAHQWFGNTATEKTFSHLWLSEGFASYLTDMYFEQKYGVDSFRKRLAGSRLQVARFAARSKQPVVDSTTAYMDLLNANSYQKGAWILHMLRGTVGDTAFRQILRRYYAEYKGGNADSRDFQRVAEAVWGRSLQGFFDQWLYQPGIPQLQVRKTIDGDEVKIRISQLNGSWEFPLEVAYIMKDGSRRMQRIPVTARETEYKESIRGVKEIMIDPEVRLLYTEKQ